MRESAPTFEELRGLVGQELGVSDWVTVSQERIDQFAQCTGDHQWIHVDLEQARRKSPLRTTIAHGYLSLSLIGFFIQDMRILPDNTQGAFNYGVNHVRFLAPVRAGARVRLRTTLLAMEDKGPGQYLMTAANTMEIEGEEKPALVAETLVMLYERRRKREA
jgi:acyl dehydratase